MPISHSDAIKEAMAVNPTDQKIFYTIEFLNESFKDSEGNTTSVRIVQDHENLMAFLEDDAPLNAGEEVEFTALAFDLTLPEMTESAAPTLNLTIDNATSILEPYLREAVNYSSRTTLIYRPYLSGQLDKPHIDPVLELDIVSAAASASSITLTAQPSNLASRAFPRRKYTIKDFPALGN